MLKVWLLTLFISGLKSAACNGDEKTAFVKFFSENTGRPLDKKVLGSCEITEGTITAGKVKFTIGGSMGTGNAGGASFKNEEIHVGTSATKPEWVLAANKYILKNYMFQQSYQTCATKTGFKMATLVETLTAEFKKRSNTFEFKETMIEECWVQDKFYRILLFVKDVGTCSMTMFVTTPITSVLQTSNCMTPHFPGDTTEQPTNEVMVGGSQNCPHDLSQLPLLKKALRTILGDEDGIIGSITDCKNLPSIFPPEMTITFVDKSSVTIIIIIHYLDQAIQEVIVSGNDGYFDNLRKNKAATACVEDDKKQIEKSVDGIENQFGVDFDISHIIFCQKDEATKTFEYTVKKDKVTCFGNSVGDEGAYTSHRFDCFKANRLVL